jgi:ubiquinone/menaquinone biosynthesis C-methylase UbiE
MYRANKEYALRLNHILPLADYLVPLVGDKPEVRILDVGSGPYAITGQLLDGVKVEIVHCDHQDFTEFWKGLGTEPLFPIEYQDMEKMTYPDDSFDIVHCVNALDHTKDARSAVEEMLRVSREWVYIVCALDQRTLQRKKHYWDVKADGMFVQPDDRFDLKDYGFEIEYKDKRMVAKCSVL